MKVVLQDCANASVQRHGAEVELVLVLELPAVDRGGAGTGNRGVGVTLPAVSSAVAVIVFMPTRREVAGQRVARVGRRVRGHGEDLPGPGPDDHQVRGQLLRGDGGIGGVLQRRRRAASAPACPATGATAPIWRPVSPVALSVLTTETVKPGGPGQLLLERPLQPGQPQLVAGGVARPAVVVLALLDDLGGGRADPAEQCDGEPGARARAAGSRSGTPRRAGRRPGRGSSRSRGGAA